MCNVNLSITNSYTGTFNDVITTNNTDSVLDVKKSMESGMKQLPSIIITEASEAGNTLTDKSGDIVNGNKIEINNSGCDCTHNYAGLIPGGDAEYLKDIITKQDEIIREKNAVIAALQETIELLKNI